MSLSLHTSLQKAISQDVIPPKAKHLNLILLSSPQIILPQLSIPANNATWVQAFKALICIHRVLDKYGNEAALHVEQPGLEMFSKYRDRNVNPSAANLGWDQTSNIRLYALYLLAYTQTLASDQPDTTSQIKALLACRFNVSSLSNPITPHAAGLLLNDLFSLFAKLNKEQMTLLRDFFALRREPAKIALKTYKQFASTTESVLEFARYYQKIGCTIPVINHVPLSLAVTLEEYCESPDFEENRKAWVKEHRGGVELNGQKLEGAQTKASDHSSIGNANQKAYSNNTVTRVESPTVAQKAQAPLIDFFASIEELTTAPQQQHCSWDQQPQNPFQQQSQVQVFGHSNAPYQQQPQIQAQNQGFDFFQNMDSMRPVVSHNPSPLQWQPPANVASQQQNSHNMMSQSMQNSQGYQPQQGYTMQNNFAGNANGFRQFDSTPQQTNGPPPSNPFATQQQAHSLSFFQTA